MAKRKDDYSYLEEQQQKIAHYCFAVSLCNLAAHLVMVKDCHSKYFIIIFPNNGYSISHRSKQAGFSFLQQLSYLLAEMNVIS